MVCFPVDLPISEPCFLDLLSLVGGPSYVHQNPVPKSYGTNVKLLASLAKETETGKGKTSMHPGESHIPKLHSCTMDLCTNAKKSINSVGLEHLRQWFSTLFRLEEPPFAVLNSVTPSGTVYRECFFPSSRETCLPCFCLGG